MAESTSDGESMNVQKDLAAIARNSTSARYSQRYESAVQKSAVHRAKQRQQQQQSDSDDGTFHGARGTFDSAPALRTNKHVDLHAIAAASTSSAHSRRYETAVARSALQLARQRAFEATESDEEAAAQAQLKEQRAQGSVLAGDGDAALKNNLGVALPGTAASLALLLPKDASQAHTQARTSQKIAWSLTQLDVEDTRAVLAERMALRIQKRAAQRGSGAASNKRCVCSGDAECECTCDTCQDGSCARTDEREDPVALRRAHMPWALRQNSYGKPVHLTEPTSRNGDYIASLEDAPAFAAEDAHGAQVDARGDAIESASGSSAQTPQTRLARMQAGNKIKSADAPNRPETFAARRDLHRHELAEPTLSAWILEDGDSGGGIALGGAASAGAARSENTFAELPRVQQGLQAERAFDAVHRQRNAETLRKAAQRQSAIEQRAADVYEGEHADAVRAALDLSLQDARNPEKAATIKASQLVDGGVDDVSAAQAASQRMRAQGFSTTQDGEVAAVPPGFAQSLIAQDTDFSAPALDYDVLDSESASDSNSDSGAGAGAYPGAGAHSGSGAYHARLQRSLGWKKSASSSEHATNLRTTDAALDAQGRRAHNDARTQHEAGADVREDVRALTHVGAPFHALDGDLDGEREVSDESDDESRMEERLPNHRRIDVSVRGLKARHDKTLMGQRQQAHKAELASTDDRMRSARSGLRESELVHAAAHDVRQQSRTVARYAAETKAVAYHDNDNDRDNNHDDVQGEEPVLRRPADPRLIQQGMDARLQSTFAALKARVNASVKKATEHSAAHQRGSTSVSAALSEARVHAAAMDALRETTTDDARNARHKLQHAHIAARAAAFSEERHAFDRATFHDVHASAPARHQSEHLERVRDATADSTRYSKAMDRKARAKAQDAAHFLSQAAVHAQGAETTATVVDAIADAHAAVHAERHAVLSSRRFIQASALRRKQADAATAHLHAMRALAVQSMLQTSAPAASSAGFEAEHMALKRTARRAIHMSNHAFDDDSAEPSKPHLHAHLNARDRGLVQQDSAAFSAGSSEGSSDEHENQDEVEDEHTDQTLRTRRLKARLGASSAHAKRSALADAAALQTGLLALNNASRSAALSTFHADRENVVPQGDRLLASHPARASASRDALALALGRTLLKLQAAHAWLEMQDGSSAVSMSDAAAGHMVGTLTPQERAEQRNAQSADEEATASRLHQDAGGVRVHAHKPSRKTQHATQRAWESMHSEIADLFARAALQAEDAEVHAGVEARKASFKEARLGALPSAQQARAASADQAHHEAQALAHAHEALASGAPVAHYADTDNDTDDGDDAQEDKDENHSADDESTADVHALLVQWIEGFDRMKHEYLDARTAGQDAGDYEDGENEEDLESETEQGKNVATARKRAESNGEWTTRTFPTHQDRAQSRQHRSEAQADFVNRTSFVPSAAMDTVAMLAPFASGYDSQDEPAVGAYASKHEERADDEVESLPTSRRAWQDMQRGFYERALHAAAALASAQEFAVIASDLYAEQGVDEEDQEAQETQEAEEDDFVE